MEDIKSEVVDPLQSEPAAKRPHVYRILSGENENDEEKEKEQEEGEEEETDEEGEQELDDEVIVEAKKDQEKNEKKEQEEAEARADREEMDEWTRQEEERRANDTEESEESGEWDDEESEDEESEDEDRGKEWLPLPDAVADNPQGKAARDVVKLATLLDLVYTICALYQRHERIDDTLACTVKELRDMRFVTGRSGLSVARAHSIWTIMTIRQRLNCVIYKRNRLSMSPPTRIKFHMTTLFEAVEEMVDAMKLATEELGREHLFSTHVSPLGEAEAHHIVDALCSVIERQIDCGVGPMTSADLDFIDRAAETACLREAIALRLFTYEQDRLYAMIKRMLNPRKYTGRLEMDRWSSILERLTATTPHSCQPAFANNGDATRPPFDVCDDDVKNKIDDSINRVRVILGGCLGPHMISIAEDIKRKINGIIDELE